MTSEAYLSYFQNILNAEKQEPPYDDADFLHYTKLNFSRLNRWIKTGHLSEQTSAVLQKINEPQNWVLITEPWCGDAAHVTPFIIMMAAENELIHLDIQLRDADSEIDKYLTGSSKSIPILVVRNAAGDDIFHWGPRPEECHILFEKLKSAGAVIDDLKVALQHWYNEDKGDKIQKEISDLLEKHLTKN